jgi:glycosyltransferase involved in cell wall biosynthesis
MKVALVHDFMKDGGAERVLVALHDLYPEAPVYTLIPHAPGSPYDDWDVRPIGPTSRLPIRFYHAGVLAYPHLIDRLDLSAYDVVISSSVSWSKGCRVTPPAIHLCYCHRPMLFAYERQADFLRGYPGLLRLLARMVIPRLRRWDLRTAGRPTQYLANSSYTAERIRALYGREARIVYPPVNTEMFSLAARAEEFYLIVSRLVPYKRIDIAVEAFTQLRLPLVVVGDGPERKRLEAMAGPTVRLVGWQTDAQIREWYAGCRAFVFPSEDDFGIAPMEAQACGKPVIAYRGGGALETVIEGETGVFFPEQRAAALGEAVRQSQTIVFRPEAIRRHALRFGVVRFRQEIREAVGACRAVAGQG